MSRRERASSGSRRTSDGRDDPGENWPHYGSVLVGHGETRPDTLIEGLISAAPGSPILPSRDELLPLRDVLQDAIETLSPREQWVFDALYSRRMSQRALARELAVSRALVCRIRDRGLRKLRVRLVDNEHIISYLKGAL